MRKAKQNKKQDYNSNLKKRRASLKEKQEAGCEEAQSIEVKPKGTDARPVRRGQAKKKLQDWRDKDADRKRKSRVELKNKAEAAQKKQKAHSISVSQSLRGVLSRAARPVRSSAQLWRNSWVVR